MATLIKRRDRNGRMLRSIQFKGGDGRRKTIGLGRSTQKQAESIRLRVEELNRSKITGYAPDDETARWLAGLSKELAEKLVRVGLIKPRGKEAQAPEALGPFIDFYIERRTDVKPGTLTKYQQGKKALVEHFGESHRLDAITEFDAEDWQRALRNRGYAENTVRKFTAVAKLFFEAAKKKRMLKDNPFESLKASIQPNADRFFFVTKEMADQVLGACPDAEWRLIFALSRYGGLRCPSEHLALKWEHINWPMGRMKVLSPKTEHHEGKDARIVPIFAELLPYLEDARELAEPDAEHVISRYRVRNSNLRTQLKRIIERAGLKCWPKLFQNLRSTRQTELEEQFPSHVVCDWIGNSERVATRHYLQITEEHFARAANALQKSTENGRQVVNSEKLGIA